MVELYGRQLSRRDLAMRTGALSQFAGVRLMTLGDGVERGVRMLEFRTGSGLRFTVMVDRGLDVGDCEYRGAAIGWHSPSGFRNPGLHEYNSEGGLGWLRSFSGLLATCGLDHIAASQSEDGDHFHHPARKTIEHTIHGRVAFIPGRLTGYGEEWRDDECWLFCEGVVQQSTVFGEDLHLLRRIEARVGGSTFTINDRVVNHGFYRTPHMLLYHFNVGYPVLDTGSRYLAPIKHSPWASHAAQYRAQTVGCRTMPAPSLNFSEQVWEHAMAADAGGRVPVALVNDALGLGFMVESSQSELPCYYQWQNFQAGHYCMGIEPATHHVLGRQFARARGEMIWLEHGESRSYSISCTVLDGGAAIAAAEQRILGIAQQPAEEFPPLSGRWDALHV